MKQLSELLKKPEEYRKEASSIKSERASLLKEFIDELNGARKKEGFKPLPPSSYAIMLSHLSKSDLYYFLKRCQEAKNFSKYFWWALKPNKNGK